MLQLEVLILELVAIDGLASSAVSGGEVATLTQITLTSCFPSMETRVKYGQ